VVEAAVPVEETTVAAVDRAEVDMILDLRDVDLNLQGTFKL
jgi:hypothetical protein